MARRVELDHKAKIAWVKNGDIALASFAFDQWGGANKAQMAAEAYMSDRTEDPWEMKARIEALERQVKAADALADWFDLWLESGDTPEESDPNHLMAAMLALKSYRDTKEGGA